MNIPVFFSLFNIESYNFFYKGSTGAKKDIFSECEVCPGSELQETFSVIKKCIYLCGQISFIYYSSISFMLKN